MNPENLLVRKQVLEGYSFPAKILAYLVLCEKMKNNTKNSTQCPNKYSTEEIIKARLSCLKHLR